MKLYNTVILGQKSEFQAQKLQFIWVELTLHGEKLVQPSTVNWKQKILKQHSPMRQVGHPRASVWHHSKVILPLPEVKLCVPHHLNYGPLQPKPSTSVCLAEKDSTMSSYKTRRNIADVGTAHLQNHTGISSQYPIYYTSSTFHLSFPASPHNLRASNGLWDLPTEKLWKKLQKDGKVRSYLCSGPEVLEGAGL